MMIQGFGAVIYSMFTSKEGTTDIFLLISLISTVLKNGSDRKNFFLMDKSVFMDLHFGLQEGTDKEM